MRPKVLEMGTSCVFFVSVSVTCLCWSLAHAEQLLFSCVSSKVSICNYVTCHISPFTCHMLYVECLCWSFGHAEQLLFSWLAKFYLTLLIGHYGILGRNWPVHNMARTSLCLQDWREKNPTTAISLRGRPGRQVRRERVPPQRAQVPRAADDTRQMCGAVHPGEPGEIRRQPRPGYWACRPCDCPDRCCCCHGCLPRGEEKEDPAENRDFQKGVSSGRGGEGARDDWVVFVWKWK